MSGDEVLQNAPAAGDVAEPSAARPPERPRRSSVVARAAGAGILGLARAITAVRGRWEGVAPVAEQRIYFANHASHGDFVLVWAVLPRLLRATTRPVAAADYWLRSPLRRFIGRDVFDAVLIDREHVGRANDPIGHMARALDAGASLIVFPEGTRNTGDAPLLPFKSGIYHLARARPAVAIVPAWIDNLNRVMPKGELVPIPLICTVTFGAPIRIDAGEGKKAFLDRAATALLSLSAKGDPS